MTYVKLQGNKFELHLSDLDVEMDLTDEEAITAYELLSNLRKMREAKPLPLKIAQ